jgi:hypothetical protein
VPILFTARAAPLATINVTAIIANRRMTRLIPAASLKAGHEPTFLHGLQVVTYRVLELARSGEPCVDHIELLSYRLEFSCRAR